MKENLRSVISRRLFRPGPLDWVFSPVYFVRRGLFKWVKSFSAGLDGSVLDYGCGSKPYADLFRNSRLYEGIDIANSLHGLSSPDIYFEDGKIPRDSQTYDAVVQFEVIDDIDNPKDSLVEVFRVLKPGGALFLSTTFSWELHEEPHDFARYTPYGIRSIVEQSGFEILDVKVTGHHIQVIGQMATMYWYQVLSRIPVIGNFLSVPIIFTTNLLTIIFGSCLPKRKALFLTNLVVARRPSS